MTAPTRTVRRARLVLTGSVAALALFASTAAPKPADAGIFFGFGVPCCGFFPGPYYGYYPPPPYYYAPPPGYYPPPPGYYPPPAPGPTAYAPATTPGYAAPATSTAPAAPTTSTTSHAAAPALPKITYTDKPAFTNSAGQTCREYKTTDGGRNVFGTACKTADGQWRVVN